MKAGLFAASIGLTLIMTQSVTAAEDQGFRHRRRAAAPTRRSPRNSNAPPDTSSSANSSCRPTLVKKIDAGEPFDVIILSYDIEAADQAGQARGRLATVFGRVGVGVAVRKGAPKPDFSTVEAFKRSLLDAKTLPHRARAAAGATSPRCSSGWESPTGQAEDPIGRPGASAQMVSRGEVDFVVSGLPPLIGTPEHRVAWLSA